MKKKLRLTILLFYLSSFRPILLSIVSLVVAEVVTLLNGSLYLSDRGAAVVTVDRHMYISTKGWE